MRQNTPGPLVALVAEFVSQRETHATLDNLFTYSGAPGLPPEGSKLAKAQTWLRITNADKSVEPLNVLGRIVETYMEKQLDPTNEWDSSALVFRNKFTNSLAEYELQYSQGGLFIPSLGIPTQTLADYIHNRNIAAVDTEFERAIGNVTRSPRDAVSASGNILESIFKEYISDRGLDMPNKLDLQSLWNIVRKDLNYDPSRVEDDDLRQILSGLISIVTGLGALRTHASSAHGADRKTYQLEPRHARLAIHSAHTVALFVFESWDRKAR